MKKTRSSFVIIVTSIILIFGISAAGHAGPMRKLGRGLANTATGWIEFFTTIREHCEEKGYMAGSVSGVPMGAAKVVIRTLAGVYEIATFPFPFPKDYESVIEPEFVMGSPFKADMRGKVAL